MSEDHFVQVLRRLEQSGKVLEKLPSEVRLAAFNALVPSLVSDESDAPIDTQQHLPLKKQSHSSSGEELFSKFSHDKPADNVKLITAYLYSQYGSESFSLAEIRSWAKQVGLTIPGRPDMTIKAALDDGKKLYQSTGREKYAPTVHGEALLKKTYGISKGTNQRPAEKK